MFKLEKARSPLLNIPPEEDESFVGLSKVEMFSSPQTQTRVASPKFFPTEIEGRPNIYNKKQMTFKPNEQPYDEEEQLRIRGLVRIQDLKGV